MTLYPRNCGRSSNPMKRIKAIAHRLLDRAKKGDKSAQDRIAWALRITGDLS